MEPLRIKTFIPSLHGFLKKYYGKAIQESLLNTLTPYEVERPDGTIDLIFVAKCDSSIHEPVSSKGRDSNAHMSIHMYTEASNLIFGFTIDNDIKLESEISDELSERFLSVLKKQDTLTLVVWDSETDNIVWVTNTFPFSQVKDQFNLAFEHYGV